MTWPYQWGSTNISVIMHGEPCVSIQCKSSFLGSFSHRTEKSKKLTANLFRNTGLVLGSVPMGLSISWHNFFHGRDIKNVLLTSKSPLPGWARDMNGIWKRCYFYLVTLVLCLNRGHKNTGVWVSKNHCSLPITCTLKHIFKFILLYFTISGALLVQKGWQRMYYIVTSFLENI